MRQEKSKLYRWELALLLAVGGVAFVAELSMNVASAAHVVFHARIVAQKYLARQLIAFASKVENSAFDESNDVDDLLQEAERNLFDLTQRNLKKEVAQIDPILQKALEKMDMARKRNSGLSGLSTGFRGLDKMTSGGRIREADKVTEGELIRYKVEVVDNLDDYDVLLTPDGTILYVDH